MYKYDPCMCNSKCKVEKKYGLFNVQKKQRNYIVEHEIAPMSEHMFI